MLATIALVAALASMIGYIDPAVCEGIKSDGFVTCEQAAQQHIWGFWGFLGFGVLVLVGGAIKAHFAKFDED